MFTVRSITSKALESYSYRVSSHPIMWGDDLFNTLGVNYITIRSLCIGSHFDRPPQKKFLAPPLAKPERVGSRPLPAEMLHEPQLTNLAMGIPDFPCPMGIGIIFPLWNPIWESLWGPI